MSVQSPFMSLRGACDCCEVFRHDRMAEDVAKWRQCGRNGVICMRLQVLHGEARVVFVCLTSAVRGIRTDDTIFRMLSSRFLAC